MMASIVNDVWLCLSAFAAGVVNALAGGGTLLTFPALGVVLGESEAALRAANVTSTLVLFPGSLASVYGYRHELQGSGPWLKRMLWPSLVGGLIGALLLRVLPASWFGLIVPWLILLATLLLVAQPLITRKLHIGDPTAPTVEPQVTPGVMFFQLLVAIYGGYFGAGIGILMLASLAVAGLHDIHRMNALKTIFASLINGVAVAIFLFSDSIAWRYVGPMMIAAIAGGWIGSAGARLVDRRIVRGVVIAIGFVLTAYYFWQRYAKAG